MPAGLRYCRPSYVAATHRSCCDIRNACQALVQPAVPFDDPRHYYQLARRLGASSPQSLWLNQFENLANFRAHYFTTGPEILQQTNGHLHAFICAAGTGGTIAGCVGRTFVADRLNYGVTAVLSFLWREYQDFKSFLRIRKVHLWLTSFELRSSRYAMALL